MTEYNLSSLEKLKVLRLLKVSGDIVIKNSRYLDGHCLDLTRMRRLIEGNRQEKGGVEVFRRLSSYLTSSKTLLNCSPLFFLWGLTSTAVIVRWKLSTRTATNKLTKKRMNMFIICRQVLSF